MKTKDFKNIKGNLTQREILRVPADGQLRLKIKKIEKLLIPVAE